MDIIQRPKQNVVLDATMLTALMKCGRYVELKHGNNFQPLKGKGNALEVGSIVHKFLEVYYGNQMKGIGKTQAFGFSMAAAEMYVQGCKDCKDFQPYDCPECAQKTMVQEPFSCELCKGTRKIEKPKCGHQPDEYPGLQNTPAESEGYIVGWKYALDTCDQYVKFWQTDYWTTVDVETVRSKVLYEDDEVRILWKAKLDWIVDTNQGIYPCDHKTMKQNKDSLSLNNQFMGQCRIMDTRNIFINKIGFQKTLKPEEKFKRVVIPYSASRLMEWQSVILPYWAKTLIAYNEQGYFPPNYNSCKGEYKCEMYEVCESDPEMRIEVLKANFYVGNPWNPMNTED